MIHISRIHKLVWHEEELPTVDYGAKVGPEEMLVGKMLLN
jgi:hypothetical protein